jgi:hypothetical protein
MYDMGQWKLDANGWAEILMQAVSDWSTGTEQFDETMVTVVDVAV